MKKRALCIAGVTLLMVSMFPLSAFAGTWQNDGYHWNYYSDNGHTVTGWLQDNENWYYMDGAGHMVSSSWIKDEEKWYYLQENGVMAHNTWIDNYFVNNSGVWTKTR